MAGRSPRATQVPPLSPSAHEEVIQRHFPIDPETRTPAPDRALIAMRDALAVGRANAGRAARIVLAARENEFETPPMREKRARDSVDRIMADPFSMIDRARETAMNEIARIDAGLQGPTPPSPALAAEIRAYLARLPQDTRKAAIADAFGDGDEMVIGAVLANVPALLAGMTKAEREVVREEWKRRKRRQEVDMINRLRRAVNDLDRGGAALMAYTQGLIDSEAIERAERKAAAFEAASRS